MVVSENAIRTVTIRSRLMDNDYLIRIRQGDVNLLDIYAFNEVKYRNQCFWADSLTPYKIDMKFLQLVPYPTNSTFQTTSFPSEAMQFILIFGHRHVAVINTRSLSERRLKIRKMHAADSEVVEYLTIDVN